MTHSSSESYSTGNKSLEAAIDFTGGCAGKLYYHIIVVNLIYHNDTM